MEYIICKCGGEMVKSETLFEGLVVECCKCKQCSHITFSEEQMRKIVSLKEMAQRTRSRRRIITVGNSMAVTLPKKLAKIGAKAGERVTVKLLGPKTILVKFDDDADKKTKEIKGRLRKSDSDSE